MSDPGPLSWLADAQQADGSQAGLWGPFREQLTVALGDLRVGAFVICRVDEAGASGHSVVGRYLQYLLVENQGQDQRVLIAQASAPKYQGGGDPAAFVRQRRIDEMGWPHTGDENNECTFPWPLGIETVVEDSLRILRDVWGVGHPSGVVLSERQVIVGGADAVPEESSKAALAEIADWTAHALKVSPDCERVPGWAWFEAGDIPVLVEASVELRQVHVVAMLGRLADDHEDAWRALVEVSSANTIAGNVTVTSTDDGQRIADLRLAFPFDGLTRSQYMAQVDWLITGVGRVHERLLADGVLAD